MKKAISTRAFRGEPGTNVHTNSNSETTGKAMNVLDAVATILKEAGTPLHVREITDRLFARNLWQSSGKTPAATVGAKIYTDIKNNGDASRFMKTAPYTFALTPAGKSDTAKAAPAPAQKASKETLPVSPLSFTDCAQKVLEVCGNRQPMHYREITRKAMENGWLATNGKTPEATMYAQIITEIKRQQGRGEQPRFVQVGRGNVALNQWNEHGLSFQIEQHNARVRKALRERLMAMSAGEFEELISILLAEMGFDDVEVTQRTHDGGIDVRGTLMIADSIRIKMAVQAKKWKLKNNVQAPVVQQVRGSLGAHEQGLIITTSDFSSGAKTEAVQPNKTPIALINGEQLVLLLMEHGIDVQRSTPDLFDMDEDTLSFKKK